MLESIEPQVRVAGQILIWEWCNMAILFGSVRFPLRFLLHDATVCRTWNVLFRGE